VEKQKCPQVRFNSFYDEWKKQKLFDVALYKNGKSHESEIVEKGKYVVVNSKFVSTNGSVKKYCLNQIEPLHNGDIAFVLSDVPNGRALSKTFLIDKDDLYTLNQRIAAISPRENCDSAFLHRRLDRHEYFLKFDDGVGQTNLSLRDMEEFISFYPSRAEQIEIGIFFQNLDQSIALHEKKLIQTQNFKKAMLEKMFPKQGSLCPEIRLKGFSGDWKRFKLGDIASIVDRKDSASTAPIMMISAASGFINQSEKYSSNNAGQSLAKYTVLQKGELAYNHGASKHKPYGACFALEVDEARIPFVYHCFNVGENNPYFTAIALNHFRIDGQLRKLISSGARMDGLLNISFDAYKTVEVMLPNKEEQDEIHNFFKSLDETLTLQQQKLRTLKNLKQALLEKMFV